MTIIHLQGVSLSFSHKTCFSDFTGSMAYGQRIAIVGDNGVGKSSLLKILSGELKTNAGRVRRATELTIGYVPQIIDDACNRHLSGGERVNHALSHALAGLPDLLLLDEPTNHLDAMNRRSMLRMLQNYAGALVLVTHDDTLMNQVCDTIWCIDRQTITVFHGRYSDYLIEQQTQREQVTQKLATLKRAQQDVHEALMKEQERASHARQRGIRSISNRKWATITSPTKLGRSNTTSHRKQAHINQQREDLTRQLEQLPSVDIIQPRFHIGHTSKHHQTIVQITDGAVGYERRALQNDINLSLAAGERLLLTGRNGSGKTTLARAIAGRTHLDASLRITGDWITPSPDHIGYLDQHYTTLQSNHSVLQALNKVVPNWTMLESRRHLSDFLFRQNEHVNNGVGTLSGGEKARLALACIAARPPQLLILDELTNNLDWRMRQHVIEIIRHYPGAMILISHDEDFLCQVAGLTRMELNM